MWFIEFKGERSLALASIQKKKKMGNFTSRVLASCIGVWRTAGVGDRPDWSSLPNELLGSIVSRLPMPDHARARAVCASWASADCPPSAFHFPWLMLDDDDGAFDSFLSLSDARSYRFRGTRTATQRAACVGSRDGCLVIVEAADTAPPLSSSSYLFNPVTGAQTSLPSFCTLPWSKTFFDVRKIVVSSSSSADEEFVAVALVYSLSCCHLAFARPGDEHWTPLDFSCPPSQRIEDIAHHDRKLFVLFTRGRVQAFDLDAAASQEEAASRLYMTCAAAVDVAPPRVHRHVRLVSSPGGLLRVESEKEVLTGATTKLSVAKFDAESDCGWTEIKDLGDRSLFLDDKCSLSLSAGDVAGVRKNCVYFVDQVPHSGKIRVGDLRTFDAEKGVVERFRPPNSRINDRRLTAPIWFVPSLL
ncbi:putative F-box protein [Iris pallida]|uniref:F-box protein n=1 Tax=Iris pallida TaxID=29817 RepID=A0AAX6FQJ1_IRIPA|nr:putative F-box protein [Iris pallida]